MRNFNYTIKYKKKYAFVEISGKFELNQAQNFISTIVKTCNEKEFDKILIDAREVDGINETIDRFKMAEFISKITPLNSKIAFLVSESQILPDKFFENVAKNRMLNAFVTTIYEDAINWLLKLS